MAGSKAERLRERLAKQERDRVRRIIESLPVKEFGELPASHRELMPIYLNPDKAKLSRTLRTRIAKAVMKGRLRPKKPLWSHWKHRARMERERARRRADENREYKRVLRTTPRGMWLNLRSGAKRKGIPFSLTEDDYVAVWMTRPGAWDRRGNKPGCTCLARIDLRKGWTKRNTAVGIRGRGVGDVQLA